MEEIKEFQDVSHLEYGIQDRRTSRKGKGRKYQAIWEDLSGVFSKTHKVRWILVTASVICTVSPLHLFACYPIGLTENVPWPPVYRRGPRTPHAFIIHLIRPRSHTHCVICVRLKSRPVHIHLQFNSFYLIQLKHMHCHLSQRIYKHSQTENLQVHWQMSVIFNITLGDHVSAFLARHLWKRAVMSRKTH